MNIQEEMDRDLRGAVAFAGMMDQIFKCFEPKPSVYLEPMEDDDDEEPAGTN